VKNVGEPLETRERENGATRFLLMALSDGHQTVIGMEYHHLPDMLISTKPGAKVSGRTPMLHDLLLPWPGGLADRPRQ
jgi:hypothetical protein